jgi:AraC family transcriptional regulator
MAIRRLRKERGRSSRGPFHRHTSEDHMTEAQTAAGVTHGVLRRQVTAGDFLLTESEYAPGLRTQAHAHSVTSLVFGLSGGLANLHDGNSGDLVPRTLLVLPRDIVHRDLVGMDGCTCLFVTLGPATLDTVHRYTPILDAIRFASGGRIGPIARALFHESRTGDSVRGLAVEGLVYDLLATLARERDPGDERTAPWLISLRDRLETEFTRPLALASLARDVGVHPVYLARAFARTFGLSISMFIRSRRIEWSMDRLRDSEDPVAKIAVAAGFFDQSHFTRAFKRIVGTTPARFRQSHARHHG